MKLKFYEVDSEYIKYLKENGDDKIPNIDYEKHKKFFCGIVLTINNFNYFAPVSSYNKKTHTAFLIMDKNKETEELKPISSLRFSFMFPCPIEYLNQKDFSKEDEKYQVLLRKELHYCNINREKIKKLANQVYKLGLVEVLETKENVIKSIFNNGFKLEKEYDINDIYLVKKEFENCKNYNELLNNSILIRDISEKSNTRKLITYKQKHIDDNGNILNQINADVEINNINDAYNMLKLTGYIELMKISDHISVYKKNNGDELALQFVNDKIYIEIEEKCEHTGKRYESLEDMKSIIKNLNLPIKDENYYAKKAEDILNDKKIKNK